MRTGELHFRLYRDPDARRKGLSFATLSDQAPDDLAWRAGTRFISPPAAPIRCTLSDRGGPTLPDAFLSDRIPLLSQRAVDVLKNAGVDNLDLYEAYLQNAAGETVSRAYFGVNIIGRVSAVDRDKSRWDPSTREPLMDLRSLVIDRSAACGAALFRLAENPSFIIVSDSVGAAIESAGLLNLAALSLTDRRAY